jgi:hypothetical protein
MSMLKMLVFLTKFGLYGQPLNVEKWIWSQRIHIKRYPLFYEFVIKHRRMSITEFYKISKSDVVQLHLRN